MASVAGSGSEVGMSCLSPMGSMTGRLFPTGNREDTFVVKGHSDIAALNVRATLIDAGNPFVLVDASTLPVPLDKTILSQPDKPPLHTLHNIRCEAAVMMGLASSIEQARLKLGTQNIAMILCPTKAVSLFPGKVADDSIPDFHMVSLSMGKMHPSLQLTGVVAISSAFSMDDTVPFRLSRNNVYGSAPAMSRQLQMPSTVCIGQRSGRIIVTVNARSALSETHVESCTVSKMARTLFEGQVFSVPDKKKFESPSSQYRCPEALIICCPVRCRGSVLSETI